MGAKGAGNPVGFMGSLSLSHITSIFQQGCKGCNRKIYRKLYYQQLYISFKDRGYYHYYYDNSAQYHGKLFGGCVTTGKNLLHTKKVFNLFAITESDSFWRDLLFVSSFQFWKQLHTFSQPSGTATAIFTVTAKTGRYLCVIIVPIEE